MRQNKLIGGGNTCSYKKPKKTNYKLKPNTDNFCLYATDVMKRHLQDIYDATLNQRPGVKEDKVKVCRLLEQYFNLITIRVGDLVGGDSSESDDFILRYQDFRRHDIVHIKWAIESLMPGEIRAMMSMREIVCGKLINI